MKRKTAVKKLMGLGKSRDHANLIIDCWHDFFPLLSNKQIVNMCGPLREKNIFLSKYMITNGGKYENH